MLMRVWQRCLRNRTALNLFSAFLWFRMDCTWIRRRTEKSLKNTSILAGLEHDKREDPVGAIKVDECMEE